MNIIDAIHDDNLFRQFLGEHDGDLSSWRNWLTVLKVIYGFDTSPDEDELILQCTGRDANKLPLRGFESVVLLTGRRCGKSRIAAVIAAFEAILAGSEAKLSPGETGMVAIISPSKTQSRNVRNYMRGIFQSTDMLRQEVIGENKHEGFRLRNGVRIEVLAGDWRTIRGYTLLAVIVDEACFFAQETDSKIKSDTELIRAIKPALATTRGKLICISSPFAKRGWCYKQWENNWGNDRSDVLVWNCPTRVMNPTIPQSVIDKAMREDPVAARSEYFAEWREEVGSYVQRDVILDCVVKGRTSLPPSAAYDYFAFVDMAGGRSDDAALAIAHRIQGGAVIIDKLCRYVPPFDPQDVIRQMVLELQRYRIQQVTGDNYAAEFVSRRFEAQRVQYIRCKKSKSELYLEAMPMLSSKLVKLPDDERLIQQLCDLERRTRSGGKDVIDHRIGGHDDLANAIAGVITSATVERIVIGSIDVLARYNRQQYYPSTMDSEVF